MTAKPQPQPTRERVASMKNEGFTVREISRALNISTQMVHKHLTNLGMNSARIPGGPKLVKHPDWEGSL